LGNKGHLQGVSQEPDTPTKAPVQPEIIPSAMSLERHPDIGASSEARTNPQSSTQSRHQNRLDSLELVKQGTTIIGPIMLMDVELMNNPSLSHSPVITAAAEENIGPSVRQTLSPQRLEKMMKALKEVDLKRDPYHIVS
jgi:hypothetical protein